jgi:hypothetical protein
MSRKLPSDTFSDEEIVRRRDEVIRRMANTPPQPHKPKSRRQGKKTPTGAGLKPKARDRRTS